MAEQQPEQYKTHKGIELEAVNINWNQRPEHAWQVNVHVPDTSRIKIVYGRTAEEAFLAAQSFIDHLENHKDLVTFDPLKVTRFEVVDHTSLESGGNTLTRGRVFSKREDGMEIELSLQDDGRTLKVFLKDRK